MRGAVIGQAETGAALNVIRGAIPIMQVWIDRADRRSVAHRLEPPRPHYLR
jgi:hypothetical protein